MMRIASALLAALALLGGCSSTEHKPTALQPLTAQIAGSQVWSADIGSIGFPLTIAARADAFVVAGDDGRVQALDVGTGRQLWQGDAGAPLAAGVGYDGRFAAVVTRDNELVVLDAGQPRWRTRLAAGVLTAPLVAGERVFVLRLDRKVQAFDVLDGRPLWTYARPGDPLSLAEPGVLAAYRNLLLVGQGSRLAALDPLRGTLRWDAALATTRGTNEVERLADLVGPATRIGDWFCARAFQTAVGCVDASRGAVRWTRPDSGATPLGGDAELLVGSDSSSRIVAWRTQTGEPAWRNETLLYRKLSGPLVAGSVVVVGDLEGQVHFFAREDGHQVLRLATDGTPVVGAPVLSGTTMLVATRGGGLFAFRP